MDKKWKKEVETGQPAPRPDHQQTSPAPRPAQARSQAGPPPDAAGLQAGPGRLTGRTPRSRRRPPGRPRPAPRPDRHRFVLDYK